jgi:hypothetical protein
MTEAINIDAVSAAYTQAKRHSDKLKNQMDDVKEDLDKLKAILLNHFNENSLKSVTTEGGEKLSVRNTTRFSSGDWPNFKSWALKTPDAIDLFENRLHQGNIKEWLADHEGDATAVPPGLTSHTTTTLAITVPKE